VAVVSIGYDGTVDEAQWAKLVPSAGSSEYGVKGAGDWKVSAHPSTAQAVNIATGTGWGQGVMDTTDAIITVQCDAISSGTRWDLIMMHRDWTPPGGSTTGGKITGSATKQIPPRANTPGVTDDQPLALVQWTAGQTQPTAIVDLRCWAGNGGMVAKDPLTLGYVARVGANITIGGIQWQYVLDSNDNPVWKDSLAVESPITKGAYSPQRTFTGLLEAVAGTDANGYGEFWFGQKGLPVFAGIQSVQLTPYHPIEGYMFTLTVQSMDTTKIRFRARRLDNSGWANGYGSISCYVTVVGW
jgi:hypothetical protein